MMKVTTESGAVYLIDGLRVLREGPTVNNRRHPDGDWLDAQHITPPKVGVPMMILWGDGAYVRFTTPVKSVVR